MGEGTENIVQVKTQLEGQKGDKVHFGIRMRLAGLGVTSGQALEGNEESLVTYYDDVSLEEYAHAVRDRGPLDRQRTVFSIDQQSQDALKDWMSEKIDKLIMDAIGTPSKIFYGDGTATTDITTAGKITPALISKAKTWALTGGARAQTPLRPIKVDGKKYFVLVVHPDVLYDLATNSTWAQAAREALPRGTDNPLFSGASYLWDGVVIHSHENVPDYTNWGSGTDVHGSKNYFLGAQALSWAWGERPHVRDEEFDYGREHGFAISMIGGVTKNTFNSKDFGVIGIYTAHTEISQA